MKELISQLITLIFQCKEGRNNEHLRHLISTLLNQTKTRVDEKVIYLLFDELKGEVLSLDQHALSFSILTLITRNTLVQHHTAEYEFSLLGKL